MSPKKRKTSHPKPLVPDPAHGLSAQKMDQPRTAQEKNPPKTKKVAFALQGGGAHGAFTWGILDKFLEDGRFEIEGLSGTSAGGLNSVALIQGMMKGGPEGARKELHHLWQSVAKMSSMGPFKNTPYESFLGQYNLDRSLGYIGMNFLKSMFSPYEFNPFNIDPFKDFIEDFFDFEALREYRKIKLFLCATQVSSGKLKLFSLEDLSLDVIRASACLPFLFQAVKIGDEHYWDGGFVGNPAIYPLIYNCETSDIFVVQLSVMRRKQLPRTAAEIRDRHKEITYNACLMREMRSIDFVTELIDKGLLDKDKIKRLFMHLLRDENLFGSLNISSALNASWDFIEFLFNQGRLVAHDWIRKHYDDIGVRTTTDMHKDFVSN